MKLPHLVIYTDRLPDGVAGAANGPLVRIRPAYRSDAGLHAHEYRHVQQWYHAAAMTAAMLACLAMASGLPWWQLLPLLPASLASHPLAYLLWPRYRLWAELEAYRVQMRYGLDADTAAARLMSPCYGFGLKDKEARRLLGA
jgi:hypothetical protein